MGFGGLFFFLGGWLFDFAVLVFGFFSQVWSSLDLSVADWIASSGLGLSALRTVVGGSCDCGAFFSSFLLLSLLRLMLLVTGFSSDST